ncbi:MAG: Ig-like domain-containing protein [Pirellulaceae bacterium]
MNDGTVDSNTATVSITVAAVNDAPVAADADVSVDEDATLAVSLSATDVEKRPADFHRVDSTD